MSRPRDPRASNLTLRLDTDVLLWARTRAIFAGTSLNELIRRFLEEYAAVPEAFREGRPPPWTPDGRPILAPEAFAQVMDPVGAGKRMARAMEAERRRESRRWRQARAILRAGAKADPARGRT